MQEFENVVGCLYDRESVVEYSAVSTAQEHSDSASQLCRAQSIQWLLKE